MAKHKQPHTHVDLGLAILSAVTKPGERRTTEEIAAYCGCSKQAISQIEWQAIRKLRAAVQSDPQHPLWDVLAQADGLQDCPRAWDAV